MKKVILILSIILSCSGCIHEGLPDDCSRSLNLIFTHDGNTAGFDRLVASDIELYLYDSEGKKIEKIHIPYENIKGGKAYALEQHYAGNTSLVAWTLSGEEDTTKVPLTFLDEENYSTAKFTMGKWPTRQAQAYSGSVQELFLGSLTFIQNPLEEKEVRVEVRKQLCSITVTIEEGDGFKTQYPGKLSMHIDGSAYSYKVAEDKQSSDRIIIGDTFSYVESSNEYISKNKVMPASADSETGSEDNIVVTLFEDGVPRLMVDTGTKARKGAQISVVIKPTKQEAIITIDSWQIRKALVIL